MTTNVIQAHTPLRRSREVLWLSLAVIATSLALVVLDSTPLDTELGCVLLSMCAILFTWLVVGIRFAILFLRLAKNRSWTPSLARSLVLATAILVAVCFFPFMRACNYLGGALRLAANRSYYDHQVALLSVSGQPQIEVFPWGGMLWSSRALVYDESDEIALPPGRQSAVWKDTVEQSNCGGWDARHLWAHYYVVEFPC